MLVWVKKILRPLLLLALSALFLFLAYVLSQWGGWAWLQVLLGAGAVLAFDAALGRGVAFNLPLALGVSLLALVALYFAMDLVFPGMLAQRVGELAKDPLLVGILLALLLFRPGHSSQGRPQGMNNL